MLNEAKASKLPRAARNPVTSPKNQNLLSASLIKSKDEKNSGPYVEKTIYRNQTVMDNEFGSRSYRDFDATKSASSLTRGKRHQRLNGSRNDNTVDWSNLGEKIEDWFVEAKSPDQKVVYHFLKNIKNEGRADTQSVLSDGSELSEKAQNLEDILNNLKRYRTRAKKNKRALKSTADLVDVNGNSGQDHCKCCRNLTDKQTYDDLYMQSSFRTMRHLKTADIRNKYPLPKANPDYHFRNATIFNTVNRPPKSTFLLHPDWV